MAYQCANCTNIIHVNTANYKIGLCELCYTQCQCGRLPSIKFGTYLCDLCLDGVPDEKNTCRISYCDAPCHQFSDLCYIHRYYKYNLYTKCETCDYQFTLQEIFFHRFKCVSCFKYYYMITEGADVINPLRNAHIIDYIIPIIYYLRTARLPKPIIMQIMRHAFPNSD